MIISDKRLRELERAEKKLQALEGGGVDNWDGYDISLSHFHATEAIEGKIDETLDEVWTALEGCAYEPGEERGGFALSEKAHPEVRALLRELLKSVKEIEEAAEKFERTGL